ncbi:hypothetical protein [Streptomyces sp. H27-H5]|uniref:hypothetical protein n=1 Tax=Streptomyces sp. H27-H5 TaxID=2996460 RepID=UPI002271AE5E|nr:hypothetical protein [Streptomyces sp. H27-H5]MCY0961121.1 hypothetical protein [Streptomyces sp. H27-H5]
MTSDTSEQSKVTRWRFWVDRLPESTPNLSARPGRSQRPADLTASVGADVYLCGTGGMKYLDAAPFAALGIPIIPFLPPTTGIWTSGRQISVLWALAMLGAATLAEQLQAVPARLACGW